MLTLAAGVALCQAVRESSAIKGCLKWPNDLLWERKKLGGILGEGSLLGSRMEYLVLGFGLNIGQETEDFPRILRKSAISLKQITGAAPDRHLLLSCLWSRLDRWYDCFLHAQKQIIITAFMNHSCFSPGEELEAETAEGLVCGLFCGLSSNGGLILEVGGKKKKYFAAEVRSLHAPKEI